MMLSLRHFQRLRIATLWTLAAALLASLLFVGSAWEETGFLGVDIDVAVQIGGLIAILVAIAGRVWCSLYIGGRKNRELVRSGPYSICRNPLYTFSIIGAAGIGAQTGSLVVAGLGGAIVWLVFFGTARREEVELERLFGHAYRRYRYEVPLLLPNFALYSSPTEQTFNPARSATTLRDALYFLIAIPVTDGIEHLQVSEWIGVALWLY